MSRDTVKIKEQNTHILFFIEKVKETYCFANLCQHHFYRQAIVLICRQFNGLDTDDIRVLIKGGHYNTRDDIQRAIHLRQSEHPKFMKIYQPLLQIYIDSTRELIKKAV